MTPYLQWEPVAEGAELIQVTIYALAIPPSQMFRQVFTRQQDADDYCRFWTRLGSCHIRTENIVNRRAEDRG